MDFTGMGNQMNILNSMNMNNQMNNNNNLMNNFNQMNNNQNQMNMNNQMNINSSRNSNYNNNPMNMNYNQMNMNYNQMNNNNNQMNMNNMMNLMMLNCMNNMNKLVETFNKFNINNNENNKNNQKKNNNNKRKGILPNKDETFNVSHIAFPEIQGKRISIIFATSTGHRFTMIVPEKVQIGLIFRDYAQKVNISPNLIGKGIYFLFNGKKFKDQEFNKIPEDFGVTDRSTILVVDTKNFIGA